MYTYRAIVTRVIDGDTLAADIDLGFNTWRRDQTLRLAGCNAREHADPNGGKQALDNLTRMLPAGTVLTLSTVKPDKYADRYDAAITLPDARDLTAVLIAAGWAIAWNGKGVKPVPPWPRAGTS